MQIEFKDKDFGGEHGVLFTPVIDGKEYSCYFPTEGQAAVYAGLIISGLSANDCSYMSRYIGAMIDGTMKGE